MHALWIIVGLGLVIWAFYIRQFANGYGKELILKSKKEMHDILCRTPNEKILMTLRLFIGKGTWKNNVKQIYGRLVITTERTIFTMPIGQADFFSHQELKSIVVTRKSFLRTDFPVVIIKSAGDTYEILFSWICPYKKTIRTITDCLQKTVPGLDLRIDPKYEESVLKKIDVLDVFSKKKNTFK